MTTFAQIFYHIAKKWFSTIITENAYLHFCRLRGNLGKSGYPKIHIPTLFSSLRSPVTFLQIGAFDGIQNDPVFHLAHKGKWKGVVVEVHPSHFIALERNYSSVKGVRPIHIGIGLSNGTASFFSVKEDIPGPDWIRQIGSFDRRSVEMNLQNFPEILSKIEEIEVQMITLRELFRKCNLEAPEVIVLDVEGYEWNIIQQLDKLDIQLPRYILYEWGCMTVQDLIETKNFLRAKGYRHFDAGGDLLAVR